MPERLAPDPWLVKWTHAEIDAGADIIVMHGAPLLHGVELYRGRPIFYDLGNFIYNVPPTLTYIDEPMSWESLVATVRVEGKAVKSISLRPVVLNPIGDGSRTCTTVYEQRVPAHPRPANRGTGARAGYILERVAAASKPWGRGSTSPGTSGPSRWAVNSS
jgi:poly-gamma-glutamate synthesis protein (capsule biosynthesis protein)